ncbi:MAG: WYL domain-containing protein [Gammaproteobacteria bacterium]|nr:WYL domain-containing protein [Gammaproteobacteria bacterium]
MDKFDRIYHLDLLLKNHRYPVPISQIMSHLECSRASVYRLINLMRDILYAPIENNEQGYFYQSAQKYELPGLWFNRQELFALLTMNQMISQMHTGLMDVHIKPLQKRIESILQKQGLNPDEVFKRIRILGIGWREQQNNIFQHAASCVLNQRQATIKYRDRSHNIESERTLSPQRISHYRDNWYLDAWCHHRKAFRTFAIDRIQYIKELPYKSKAFSEDKLNQHYATAYGIFAGEADKEAVLWASPKLARWLAEEQWHPKQTGQWLENGKYQITIPYHNHTELIMDILKYGAEIKVIGPDELKRVVADEINKMQKHYPK